MRFWHLNITLLPKRRQGGHFKSAISWFLFIYKRRQEAWITHRASSTTRSRKKRKYQKQQTRENWENKRKSRNEATRLGRKAVREYWKTQSSLLKSKLSQFYKTFMPFFSTKNKKTDNDHLSLTIDGDVCHDRPKIANHLCNYFANNAHGVGNIDEISAHVQLYRI